MRILVYGAGAVGLGLADCLMVAGARVHVIARPETVELLRREGLFRTGIFGDHHALAGSFGDSVSLDEIPASPGFDYLLVCVKSFDSPEAARDIARHPAILEGGTKIVLCQNGWGNHEIFVAALPDVPLYSARVITGFVRPRPNRVEITVHADAVHVGTLGPEPIAGIGPLCRALSEGGLPCEPTRHIGRDLWAKMLYNCSLNPLGALFGVPYGTLAEYEVTRRIMNEAHAEVFRVMRASGYETHWSGPEAYEKDFYGHLVPSTAAHYSSTLQDLRARRCTEIDALNGAVVELGRRHGVPVPVNETLYRLIKFQEAHGSMSDPDRKKEE